MKEIRVRRNGIYASMKRTHKQNNYFRQSHAYKSRVKEEQAMMTLQRMVLGVDLVVYLNH